MFVTVNPLESLLVKRAFGPIEGTAGTWGFGCATIMHPHRIHRVVDAYLGHVPTPDLQIIHFLAFHSREYVSPPKACGQSLWFHVEVDLAAV